MTEQLQTVNEYEISLGDRLKSLFDFTRTYGLQAAIAGSFGALLLSSGAVDVLARDTGANSRREAGRNAGSPVNIADRFEQGFLQQIPQRIEVIETDTTPPIASMEVTVNTAGINIRSLPSNEASIEGKLSAGVNIITDVTLNGVLDGKNQQVWMRLADGTWFQPEVASVSEVDIEAAIINFGIRDVYAGVTNPDENLEVIQRTDLDSNSGDRQYLAEASTGVKEAIDSAISTEKAGLSTSIEDAGFNPLIEIFEIDSGHDEDGHLGLGLIGLENDSQTGQDYLWIPVGNGQYERAFLPSGANGFWEWLSTGNIRVGFEVGGQTLAEYVPGVGWTLSSEAPEAFLEDRTVFVSYINGLVGINELIAILDQANRVEFVRTNQETIVDLENLLPESYRNTADMDYLALAFDTGELEGAYYNISTGDIERLLPNGNFQVFQPSQSFTRPEQGWMTYQEPANGSAWERIIGDRIQIFVQDSGKVASFVPNPDMPDIQAQAFSNLLDDVVRTYPHSDGNTFRVFIVTDAALSARGNLAASGLQQRGIVQLVDSVGIGGMKEDSSTTYDVFILQKLSVFSGEDERLAGFSIFLPIIFGTARDGGDMRNPASIILNGSPDYGSVNPLLYPYVNEIAPTVYGSSFPNPFDGVSKD